MTGPPGRRIPYRTNKFSIRWICVAPNSENSAYVRRLLSSDGPVGVAGMAMRSRCPRRNVLRFAAETFLVSPKQTRQPGRRGRGRVTVRVHPTCVRGNVDEKWVDRGGCDARVALSIIVLPRVAFFIHLFIIIIIFFLRSALQWPGYKDKRAYDDD